MANFSAHGPHDRATHDRTLAFTLIELMVVIAIIVLAAGLMTPTITDFFKNRQLESVRGQFGSLFNKARMDAVNSGGRVSLVFWREGARVYFDTSRTFDPLDNFSPETSAFSDDKIWFELGFCGRSNPELPKFRDWEKEQKALLPPPAESPAGKGSSAPPLPTYNVNGLPKLTFERDGTVTFSTGDDVDSQEFKKSLPEKADMMIRQVANSTVCFIDIRQTGQTKSKVVSTREIKPRPSPTDGESGGRPPPSTEARVDASSETKDEPAPEQEGGGE